VSYLGSYGIHNHEHPSNLGISPVSSPNAASNDGSRINSIYLPLCNYHDSCRTAADKTFFI